MRRLPIILSAVFLASLCAACVGSAPSGPSRGGSDPGPSGSTTTPGGSSGPTGSQGSGGFGAGEPQLVDTDEDGVPDAVDVEPDGDPDYQFDITACGEPRIDADRDGHVDGIDLDCSGQVDLRVLADHRVTPAPGANCSAGEPGEGPGHGAGGYGCD